MSESMNKCFTNVVSTVKVAIFLIRLITTIVVVVAHLVPNNANPIRFALEFAFLAGLTDWVSAVQLVIQCFETGPNSGIVYCACGDLFTEMIWLNEWLNNLNIEWHMKRKKIRHLVTTININYIKLQMNVNTTLILFTQWLVSSRYLMRDRKGYTLWNKSICHWFGIKRPFMKMALTFEAFGALKKLCFGNILRW